jgi:hypothetical protein
MVKVIKVELEDEDEDFSKYWKSFFILIGTQLIMSWLYSQCQRRRSTKKNKVEVEEYTEEELLVQSEDEGNSSEEFELIANESVEDEVERTTLNQRIFITRQGDTYHLSEECVYLDQRPRYERTPCEDSLDKTKEPAKKETTKKECEETKIYITQKDRYYHDPSCEKLWTVRHKSKKVKCLDCQWKEKKDVDSPSQTRRRGATETKGTSKGSGSRSSTG